MLEYIISGINSVNEILLEQQKSDFSPFQWLDIYQTGNFLPSAYLELIQLL